MPCLSQSLKKIVCINDLCSIGHISLNVNIPLLSCLGYHVIPIATTTLSRHTAFSNAKRVDINDSFTAIVENMIASNDQFDAILVGYLANVGQIDQIIELIKMQTHAKVIIDPVCGDNGKLYKGMDKDYVNGLRKLLPYANVIIPNLSEAYALLDLPLDTPLTHNLISPVVTGLHQLTNAKIIITGIKAHTKVMCLVTDENSIQYQANDEINCYVPGTGDIFASLITGYYLKDYPLSVCVEKAARFIGDAIKALNDSDYPLLEGIPIEHYLFTLN